MFCEECFLSISNLLKVNSLSPSPSSPSPPSPRLLDPFYCHSLLKPHLGLIQNIEFILNISLRVVLFSRALTQSWGLKYLSVYSQNVTLAMIRCGTKTQRVPESGVSGEWGDDQTVSLNQIFKCHAIFKWVQCFALFVVVVVHIAQAFSWRVGSSQSFRSFCFAE